MKVLWYSSKVTSLSLTTYMLAIQILDMPNLIPLKRLLRDKTLESLLTQRQLRSLGMFARDLLLEPYAML